MFFRRNSQLEKMLLVRVTYVPGICDELQVHFLI